MTYPPLLVAWSVWALGTALYFTGFFQRVAPAVMTGELMTEFGIGAAGLGNLSAFYLYGYVAMQIPTGLLVDRFGPRRVLSAGASVAAAGSLLFALASDYATASLGRLLIGGSVGVAWVGTLKLAAHWHPPQRFALASGLALATGLAGAIGAGVPLRWAIDAFGWRAAMLAVAVAIAIVGLVIWRAVRDDPAERGYRSYFAGSHVPAAREPMWHGLREVLRHRNMWIMMFAGQGVTGATIAFGGLWGVPYLVSVHGYSQERAALYCSALLLGWAAGGPVFGALSDRLGRRKMPYLACSLAALLAWCVIVLHPSLAPGTLLGMLVCAGFFAGVMVTGFAFAKESVPARYAGAAGGVANMGSMTGPMVLQPLIGLVLDLRWSGALSATGARLYDAGAYRAAFLLILLWLAVSSVVTLFARETYCRQAP